MKDPYALSKEITIALSRIYLRRIILPVFTLEISRAWPLNYSKWKKIFLSNTIMSHIYPITVLSYNLRSQTDFLRNTVNTTKFGLNSLRHFASRVWSMTPIEIKNSSTIDIFKSQIRKWEPNDCDWKLCHDYLHRIGCVNLVDI